MSRGGRCTATCPTEPGAVSLRNLALTILTVLALSVGQVLFKLAARGLGQGMPSLAQVALNKYLIAAVLVYGVATALWVSLLREMPLTVAYPFAALAFFFVPVMGHLLLDEPLRWQTLLGAAVISAGVWISSLE